MIFKPVLAALIAAAIFPALFAVEYYSISQKNDAAVMDDGSDVGFQNSADFDLSHKNYASVQQKRSSAAQITAIDSANPQNEKYEKIGTLRQVTRDFDAEHKRITELVSANNAVIQHERALGLNGQRILQLGIGVPPEKFDAFIETARGFGKGLSLEIVKNDKTNEYLQLKAKRQTLEKARTALEEFRSSGGSIEERVTVQNRITEIEQQIQDLGVSLGEFDTQNELCTVKFTLQEWKTAKPVSLRAQILRALKGAIYNYALLGIGFFGLLAGLWLVTLVAGKMQEIVLRQRAQE